MVRWLGLIDQAGRKVLELPYYRKDADPNQGREIGNMYRRQRDRWHGGYCLQSSKTRKTSTGGKGWLVLTPGDLRTEVAVLDSVRLSDSVDPDESGAQLSQLSQPESLTRGSQQDLAAGHAAADDPAAEHAATQRDGFAGARSPSACAFQGCGKVATARVEGKPYCTRHEATMTPAGKR